MSRHGDDGEGRTRSERNNAGAAFGTVREQLRYWPYTVHQIDDTLDIDLIEGRGRQLMFQAMNSHMLTAFAGSGLSAAYGRLGWKAWQDEQFSVVALGATQFNALAEEAATYIAELIEIVRPARDGETETAPLRKAVRGADSSEVPGHDNPAPADHEKRRRDRYNAWRWLQARRNRILGAQKQVEHLHRTFRRSRSKEGEFPGGEELPIKFQIAQQLHEELRRHVGLFLPPRLGEKGPPDAIEREEVILRAWPGSRVDRESAAPTSALGWIKRRLRDANIVGSDKYNKALTDYIDIQARPQARVSAEDYAKMLLVDERAHAMITLRGGLYSGRKPGELRPEEVARLTRLEAALGIYDPKALQREIPGIREEPERYLVLRAFEFRALDRIREAVIQEPGFVNSQFAPVVARIENLLSEYRDTRGQAGSVERTYITPSSRFLVGAHLALLENPWALVQSGAPLVSVATDEFAKGMPKNSPLFEEPTTTGFRGRRSIIARRFDPLSKIVRGLGIRRFITLNYDFEIERYFQDAGYRSFPRKAESIHVEVPEPPDDDASRTDGLGGVLTDRTFHRSTASDLVEFAVAEETDDAGVFHLHGRATQKDSLVITERDYMDLYLLEDAQRDTVNEGIAMAFSSSPLIFLGLGMEEADLLRPLRQFMSNRDRTIGYRAVALLPADKTIDARTKFAVSTFLRYGVHTIFYGSGSVEVEGQKERLGLDWLCRMMRLRTAVSAAFKALRKGDTVQAKPEAVMAGLVREVGAVSDDISGYGNNDVSALGVLYGRDIVLPDETEEGEAALIKNLKNLIYALIGKERTRENATEYDSAGLRTCYFTPIRPELMSKASRHHDPSLAVDGGDYVGFATNLLDETVRLLLRAHASGGVPLSEREHDAAQLVLDGLAGALLTGSLNAQLEGLEREWRSWWGNWQQSPPHRIARFQRLSPPDDSAHDHFEPARFVRHHVDSIITRVDDLDSNAFRGRRAELIEEDGSLRECQRTGIRAFDTFVEAVAADRDQELLKDPDPQQRFMVTIAAARGFGKGTMLTTMTTRKGLSLYEAAIWRRAHRRTRHDPFLLAAIFVNLSFSTEIASTFDMIIDALRRTTLAMAGALADAKNGTSAKRVKSGLSRSLDPQLPSDPKKSVEETPYRLENAPGTAWADAMREEHRRQTETYDRLSRRETIVDLFNRFGNLSEALCEAKRRWAFGRPRLLLYLNSLELTFRSDGQPKNAEIAALYNLLLRSTANMPLDIVLVGAERSLGQPFNIAARPKTADELPPRGFYQFRLDRPELGLEAQEQIQERIRAGNIMIDERNSAEGSVPAHLVNHVHYARPVSPSALLLDNFPVLALALHANRPFEKAWDKTPKGGAAAQVAYDNAREVYARMHQWLGPDRLWSDSALPAEDTLKQRAQMEFAVAVHYGLTLADTASTSVWSDRSGAPRSREIDDARMQMRDFVVARLRAHVVAHAVFAGTFSANETIKLINELGTDKKEAAAKRAFREALQRRQEAETVGGFGEWRLVRRRLRYNRFAQTLVLATAENVEIHAPGDTPGSEAEAFIRFVVDQVRNVGDERRDGMILQLVIDRYKRFAMIGDPDLDMELHEILIKHLAVIGSPVSAAVLVRVPEVRDYFVRIGIETETSRRRFVARALTTMAYRGFVFRMDPHPRLMDLERETEHGQDIDEAAQRRREREKDTYWPAEVEYRYGLHRTIRLHAIGKLGVSKIDPVRQNSFAPRLYSAMESTGIGITPDSYTFLKSLLVGLSQYPDVPNHDVRLRPWLFTTRYRNIRVQALRAAMSLSRTTLSAATVSRLTPDPSVAEPHPKMGLMEVYKVRLRWLIRMSWELVDPDQVKQIDHDPRVPLNHLNALYRDEIVWLYNEIGTVCLVQGALSEALGFLRQAAEFNTEIEGNPRSGPMGRHISLNHAIVQFERGRLGSAQSRLKAIRDSEDGDHLVTTLAEGYSLVIQHLTGNVEGLADGFDRTIRKLQNMDQPRASALFLVHAAKFNMAMGAASVAKEQFARARGYAETGGHEDVRQLIEVAELQANHGWRSSGPPEHPPEVLRRLEHVEAYGRQMGIWNLQVESLTLRAQILLDTGETATSGGLAVRAMAIAKRNGMILRLNGALTIYARVLLLRKDMRGARRHANLSLRLAKRINYATQTARAQDILARVDSD